MKSAADLAKDLKQFVDDAKAGKDIATLIAEIT